MTGLSPVPPQIQQLQGDTTVEVDDDGSQQVIIILPDKLGEQPGDVAALLPSLGLTAPPDASASLSMVQQPKDLEQQVADLALWMHFTTYFAYITIPPWQRPRNTLV